MSKETEVSQKTKILIVEDEPGPREAITLVLRPFFELHWAECGDAALQILKDVPDIEILTLDLVLPGQSGVDLLHEIKRHYDTVEVIIITGYGNLLSPVDCFRYGAAAYLIKPFDEADILREVHIALGRKRRLESLRGVLTRLQHTTRQGFTAETARQHLAQDPVLLEHSEAVCRYAMQLSDRLRLSATEHEHLEVGALLHDIGLLAIDDQIKRYPFHENLSQEDIQQSHTQIGSRMAMEAQLATPIIEIIHHHHERYDGSGYPHHLFGEDIPYLARIVAIANSIDHVTSTRVAKRLTPREMQAFLKVNAGGHFDPWLIELCRAEAYS